MAVLDNAEGPFFAVVEIMMAHAIFFKVRVYVPTGRIFGMVKK